MGLIGDIQEFKKNAKSYSTSTKVLLGVILLMQMFTLASIAESVANFKGFIFYGIKFYQMIRNHVVELLAIIQIRIPAELFDSLFFGVLFFRTTFNEKVRKLGTRFDRRSDYVRLFLMTVGFIIAFTIFIMFHHRIKSELMIPSLCMLVLTFVSLVVKSWIPIVNFFSTIFDFGNHCSN